MSERPWLREGPLEHRVESLLAELTLAEKAGQLNQPANVSPGDDHDALAAGRIGSSLYASGALGGNERDEGLSIAAIEQCQRIAVEESRLGIPVLFGRDVIHGHRTVFPIPLGLAAGWDPDLVERLAAVAGEEAAREGVAWTFAPMVDISEEPRWGRVAEGFGEAPVLSGRLAAASVRGFQRSIGATAKHFVGYGLAAGGRDYDTVQVGENTLRNLHLRTFRDAVDAGVLAVMASFNDVDGTPMHANRRLVREVLKDEWGFDGVVVADWSGVGQLVDHGVAADARDAARQALLAGVDLDMASGCYLAHAEELVVSGAVPAEIVDDAVRRVLRMKFRLGLFDDPYPRTTDEPIGPTASTRALAREAAASSLVLVGNDGVLPLREDVASLHLTGPFVDDGEALLGTWVLDGRGEDVATPLAAFTELLGERVSHTDGRFSDLACHRTREAAVTVALLGEHPSRSGEANSVADLGLPAGQLEALRQLCDLGKPVVAVVFAGRPLDLTEVLRAASAVLVAWHPGTETGPALADVLFGRREPRGRLPMTFPRSTGHVPSSIHARGTSRVIDFSRDVWGGRYLDALTQPQLPFGFGLAYTTFEIGPPALDRSQVPLGGEVGVQVPVANTGGRPGRAVVQLYLHDPVADVTRPKVELLDWQAIDVDAGATGSARFTVSTDAFGYYGRDLSRRVDTGLIRLIAGPDAAHGQAVELTVTEPTATREDDA
ncbi:glycoside hydrolase family 3 N-terminal domain-containing protein [Micropruina sonneratiae]|uniref:glycoside hydrolase family 3 N-terminal domain-containing protein n=1 Tax=Micropruina sonneratiae TaxID=2986940 RepID=UPI0022262FB1|nr:glycoside hydrolase family 3 N-terminal domain-containing protein [Micropruina sp. KQZ13P-5]MCW3158701.1 glycoside hydrolase family 3 C-terminal domain-containing protein [Micropruina sp. KQZ13P-5]